MPDGGSGYIIEPLGKALVWRVLHTIHMLIVPLDLALSVPDLECHVDGPCHHHRAGRMHKKSVDPQDRSG